MALLLFSLIEWSAIWTHLSSSWLPAYSPNRREWADANPTHASNW